MRIMRALLLVTLTGSVLGFSSVARATDDPTPPARAAAKASMPPVFSKTAFADALSTNKTDGKILVVKFTAEWCGPCKQMDKTTWRDPDVVEFVKQNGVAIQVDVDREQKIAQEYNVRAMPTMILFKGGEPVDRVVGGRDGKKLLSWMNAAKDGKTENDVLAERVKAGGDDVSMRDRMTLARSYMMNAKDDLARAEYLWLWENMLDHEPAMLGVRSSFMANDMQELAARDAKTKEAFTLVRDQVEKRLKGDSREWEDMSDWIVLNEVVGDDKRTLQWFDRVKDDPEGKATIERFSYRLDRLLQENERWADFGRMIQKPKAEVQQEWQFTKMSMNPPGADEALAAQVREMSLKRFRKNASTTHAALLLAGRMTEASEVVQAVLAVDDTPEARIALVERALELKAASPELARLLDEAKAKGADVADLKKDLDKAAARAKP